VIDTHCHLLPGLDDGPRRLQESVALARQLVECGVRQVICTPHFTRRYPTDHQTAARRLHELRAVLDESRVPLMLGLAAEIGSAAACQASQSELTQRTIGTHHLLVELERDTPAGVVEPILDRLALLGCTPVLAHPERCRNVRHRMTIIDAARRHGALIQVVAPSLVGRWGEDVSRAAWRMLDSGRVDILASDSHRAPRHGHDHLKTALALVAKRLGADALRELTVLRPAGIVAA
jgi:protein-tyrosine phosphatase